MQHPTSHKQGLRSCSYSSAAFVVHSQWHPVLQVFSGLTLMCWYQFANATRQI